MYKAIFLDLDGTLLRSDLTIGKDTISALKKATGLGMRIVLCSGRYRQGLRSCIRMLGMSVIESCINGALICDGERTIRKVLIDKAAYREAASYVKGRTRSGIAFTENRYAIDADDEFFDRQCIICDQEGIRMDIRDPDEVERRTGESIHKILLKDSDSQVIQDLGAELKERFSALPIRILCSDLRNLEILPEGIDKSDSVRIVSEYLGIGVDETIAFGDWDNDIGMIGAAGLGIAMGNCCSALRESADIITLSNNDDGIAYALERYVFPEMA